MAFLWFVEDRRMRLRLRFDR